MAVNKQTIITSWGREERENIAMCAILKQEVTNRHSRELSDMHGL